MTKEKSKKDCLKRINYLMGHLEGVKKMLEEDRYCIDVIQQNMGVIAALHGINEKLLDGHMNHCVTHAILSGNSRRKQKVFNEILRIYKMSFR